MSTRFIAGAVVAAALLAGGQAMGVRGGARRAPESEYLTGERMIRMAHESLLPMTYGDYDLLARRLQDNPVNKYCSDEGQACVADASCAVCIQGYDGKVASPAVITCNSVLMAIAADMPKGCNPAARKTPLNALMSCIVDVQIPTMPCKTDPAATPAPTPPPTSAPTMAPTVPKTPPPTKQDLRTAIEKNCAVQGKACKGSPICDACLGAWDGRIVEPTLKTCAAYLANLQLGFDPSCAIATPKTLINDVMVCILDTAEPTHPCGTNPGAGQPLTGLFGAR